MSPRGATATAPKTEYAVVPRQCSFPMVMENWDAFNAICTALSKSNKTGTIKTVESMLAVCIQGAELGLPPMTAINSIHPIEGSLRLSAQCAQALVLRDMPGSQFEIGKETNTECEVTLTVPGRPAYTASFTIEDAKIAKLVKPNSNWEKSPKDMLYSKAVIRACRRVCPDVLAGMYCVEEFGDVIDVKELPQAIEPEKITATVVEVAAIETTETAEVVVTEEVTKPEPTPSTPANGTNGHANGTNGHTNGTNGTSGKHAEAETSTPTAVASVSASGPKIVTSQKLELKRLREQLNLKDARWQDTLAAYNVSTALDLSSDQAMHLIGVLRKREAFFAVN